MHSIALLLTFGLAVARTVDACVHTYTYNDELHVHRHLLQTSPHYTYTTGGSDWGSLSPAWTTCSNGQKQTPVNMDSSSYQSPPILSLGSWRTDFTDLGAINNIRVINTGHSVQVEFDWARTPTATVSVFGDNLNDLFSSSTVLTKYKKVPFTPIQFHCHTFSEHWLNGQAFAAEVHIVAKIVSTDLASCDPPCLMVIGIPLRLGAANPKLQPFLDAVPAQPGTPNYLPGVQFELKDLLPSAQPSYVTYEGSLTTPPCSEGLRWHVLTQPQTISLEQVAQLQAVAAEENGIPTNARYPQPLNGRKLYYVA